MGKRNATETLEHSAATTPSTPQKRQKLQDAVHLNQSVTETPPQTYTLTKELVEDTVLLDLNLQKWRVGQPVGTYNFISQSVCLSSNYVATATYPFPIPHPVRIRWPPSRRIGLLLAFLILSLKFPSRVVCGLLRLLFKYLCNFDKYPNLSFSLSDPLSEINSRLSGTLLRLCGRSSCDNDRQGQLWGNLLGLGRHQSAGVGSECQVRGQDRATLQWAALCRDPLSDEHGQGHRYAV